jgi:hypothetical protein
MGGILNGSDRHGGPNPSSSRVVQALRAACAAIADQATQVQINRDAIAPYAASLETARPPQANPHPVHGTREQLAAFWLTLDAVNFGSGWFPTLRKRPGRSGYDTVAAGIRERFRAAGPWSATELQNLGAADLARVTGQEPEHELMALFAASLNDLGAHLSDEHAGSFAALADSGQGSAEKLANHLGSWACFADCSNYDGIIVPFLKRAQIAAADLARAGVTDPPDLERLTMFADNLVPHVLRLDGILTFGPDLVARIATEQLIAHGSPEEVEIRACALHAVELIVAERPGTCAAQIDEVLWNRGRERRYKAVPRHRSRCTAY